MSEDYNEFCKSKGCEHYVEWAYMGHDCVSCRLVGKTHDIEDYPDSCIHVEEIVLIQIE